MGSPNANSAGDMFVEKTVYKPVTCERCGCKYGYRLSASGKARLQRPRGFSGVMLDAMETGVQQSNLVDDAYRDAYKKLDSTHRAVACPKCRWYQRKMSISYGTRRLVWLRYAAMLFLGPACLGALMAFAFLNDGHLDERAIGLWLAIAAMGFGVVAAAFHFGGKRMAMRYDLNFGYPDHPVPIPGEPEAILVRPSNPYINHGVDDSLSGWQTARGQQQFGPFSWTQVYDMAVEGRVIASDYILPPGGTEWLQAGTVTELELQ